MLQQTRVAAVIDHYRIFLNVFRMSRRSPQLRKTPCSPPGAVWATTGERAGCISARSRIAEQARRLLPAECRSFAQTLPGIGRYTAAAIASIAFAEPVAVVDGNVERVLQRLIGIEVTGINLTTPQTWQHAQALLASSRPGDFNQAMMELGATVCVPRQPRCPTCPLRKWCVGANSAITMERRASSPGRTLTRNQSRRIRKAISCVLDRRNGRIRLVQRPRKSPLMPGMWELPQLSRKAGPGRRFPPTGARSAIPSPSPTTLSMCHMPRARASAAKGKWIAIDRTFPISPSPA